MFVATPISVYRLVSWLITVREDLCCFLVEWGIILLFHIHAFLIFSLRVAKPESVGRVWPLARVWRNKLSPSFSHLPVGRFWQPCCFVSSVTNTLTLLDFHGHWRKGSQKFLFSTGADRRGQKPPALGCCSWKSSQFDSPFGLCAVC